MVTLSSFYTHIYRVFLIITMIINFLGILIIKLFIPKEKAASYDLTPFVMLIIVCGIILIFFLKLANVNYDKENKILNIQYFKNNFTISSRNIVRVERIFIFLCKITYEDKTSQKSIIFLPSLRIFFPLFNYPQKIRDLIRE